MSALRGQQVLVVGLGETGLSLVRYLVAQGAQVRVADSRVYPPGAATLRSEFPQVELHCGVFCETLLYGTERIAISPGVAVAEPLIQAALARGIPVVGDIELLAQEILAQPVPPQVIAITGANGKTTVTSMVGAMCVAAGLDTQIAGNISPAVLDALRERNGRHPAVWVLELSSFQLETTYSLNADAAVVLNVTEDHLDRYDGSMNLYAAAKARIFQGDGVQLVNRDDGRSAAMLLAGRKQLGFALSPPQQESDWGIGHEGNALWLMQGTQRIMRADELQVTGLHNVANALAALALCRAIDLPLTPLLNALHTFKGLPHRVEKVAEVAGITYYDDSKGTNVGATEAALQGLGKMAVVILGGEGKGQDFSPLRTAVARHARAAVLIGRDASLIEIALQGCGKPILHATDMSDAVQIATHHAQIGDAVLMSPACASFDMYRNYLHRAEAFIAAVQQLADGAATHKEAAWSH